MKLLIVRTFLIMLVAVSSGIVLKIIFQSRPDIGDLLVPSPTGEYSSSTIGEPTSSTTGEPTSSTTGEPTSSTTGEPTSSTTGEPISSTSTTEAPLLAPQTSPSNTEMTIVNLKSTYKVGEKIHVHIRSKDELKRDTNIGGDLYAIRLVVPDKNISMASNIKDHGDGTYSSFIPLFWEGKVYIEGRLVMPSAAVNYAKRVQSSDVFVKKWVKRALFTHNDTTVKVQCDLDSVDKLTDICDLTIYNGMEPWFCQKHPDFPCSSFSSMDNPKPIPDDLDENRYRFNDSYWKIEVKLKNLEILVSPDPNFKQKDVDPLCKPGIPAVYPTGYFENQKWKSLVCKIKSFSAKERKECLKNKYILLFGDSNTRDLSYVMDEELKGT